MEFEFLLEGQESKVSIEERDGLWFARAGDNSAEMEIVPAGSNTFWIVTPAGSFAAHAAVNEGKYYVFARGRQFCLSKPGAEVRKRTRVSGALKAEEVIGAPMPGVIVKVAVSDGDVVKTDQVLVVVESMKMENNIRAHGDARVKCVHVKAGESVNFGSPLVELEPVSS
ncbi:MAG: biotin/lipoyl-containing protein [Candidatus Eisenbacteria bacterium]